MDGETWILHIKLVYNFFSLSRKRVYRSRKHVPAFIVILIVCCSLDLPPFPASTFYCFCAFPLGLVCKRSFGSFACGCLPYFLRFSFSLCWLCVCVCEYICVCVLVCCTRVEVVREQWDAIQIGPVVIVRLLLVEVTETLFMCNVLLSSMCCCVSVYSR